MNVKTFKSEIHGIGLFSIGIIKKGEAIKPSPFHTRCLINHSEDPNTERDENYNPIAKRDIRIHEEIVEDYRLLPKNDRPCICSGECIYLDKC